MFGFDVYVTRKHLNLDKIVAVFCRYFEEKGNKFDKTDPDIVFVFGGDGSLLEAIKEHLGAKASFMMINAGTLGFCREYDLSELDELYHDFDFSKLVYESHNLVRIKDNEGHFTDAVNEIILASPIETVNLQVSINNEYLMSARGSGIYVASPFGSTGYNYSFGGPIVSGNQGMILSLVAPIHNKFSHPLVSPLIVSDKDIINIQITNDADFAISADMRNLHQFQGKTFSIMCSPYTFSLAHSHTNDLYQRIKRTIVD